MSGSPIIGGTAWTDTDARITRSASDWVTFALPMHTFERDLGSVDSVGIQVAVQPRGMVGAPAGMVSAETDVRVDSMVAYTAAGAGLGWQMKDIAPHELGHLFGAVHEDGGVMSYARVKTEGFEPVTLDKIRTHDHP